MARVLITNAYSARNRGDAAIIHGMIDSLRRHPVFRDAEIRISTADHPADAGSYPVPTVASFHSLKNRVSTSPAANLLFFALVLLPVSLLWAAVWRAAGLDLPVPAGLRRLMREYRDADMIVAAGGGYLYTRAAIRGNLVLLANVYSFFFAVLLGKPVVLFAQSIGPFAGRWQARLVRRALAGVDLVEVREELSLKLLEGWRIETPVRLVADAAFAFDARRPDGDLGIGGTGVGPIVGVTVRNWFRDRGRQQDYERTMAVFVAWLVGEKRATVVFLPQVTFADGGDDDRESARRVAASSGATDELRIVEDELAAAEVKWLCGRMDFFVGTRMHSNIFALASGVPTLAIAYQPKTAGIMAALGLGDDVLSIDGLTAEDLQRAFDALIERAPMIRDRLRSVLPEIREKAYEAGWLIGEIFAARGCR